MAGFVKGEVVVIPFPFSDLSGSKKRPELVLCDLEGDYILLCQITSQQTRDKSAIPILSSDFLSGRFPVSGFIHPLRIFTADKPIIQRRAVMVKPGVIHSAIESIVGQLRK